MRRLMVGLLLTTSLLLPVAWSDKAQAHVLERGGGISAVLHMPPDDEPVAAQSTIINLAFASSDQNFTIANYTIALEVKRNGRTTDTQIMQSIDRSDTDASATIVLPAAGAYQLVVKGSPKSAGDGFSLKYDIRASSPAGQTSQGADSGVSSRLGFNFWALCLGSWVILAIVARAAIHHGGRYSK